MEGVEKARFCRLGFFSVEKANLRLQIYKQSV